MTRIISLLVAMLLGLLFLSVGSTVVWSTAWVPAPGEGEFNVSARFFETSRILNANTDEQDFSGDDEFRQFEVNPYVNVGIADRTSLFVNSFYVDVRFSNEDGRVTNSGIGNTEVGIQYRLSDEDAERVWTLQPLIKFPPPDSSGEPQLADDQEDFELRLLVAEPFQAFNRWGFWNVELGYRFRNRAPSDEIRFDSSVGYNFTQDWMLLQQFFTITSAGNADSVELTELEGNPSVFPEFDMYKAKLSLARDVSPNVTLHAGVSHTFAGTNIGGGPSFVLGFWSNF